VRTKIADEIEKARQQGDLSENAAYKSAIESKEFNENRINQLKELLSNAEISTKSNSGVVDLGRRVTIQKS
ncbi:MAG TPA: transcription elongation factor GreA, partial [Candidatus Dojkabacteria bacterium]|nr:transcription elongation factor GreA [Candidatus Dojkabacteria bacterium]